MSELKSALFAMALFVAFIIPLFLQVSIGSLHQHAFMKWTTEVTTMVEDEGGRTSKVDNVIGSMEEKGYTVSIKNGSGQSVNGKQDYGTDLIVEFDYDYKNVRGIENLSTKNEVSVTRR